MSFSYTLSFVLILLMIINYVMTNVIPGEHQILNVTDVNLISPVTDENKKLNEVLSRVRRDCDCVTTTGRCFSHGGHQCWFGKKTTMVQCVVNKWETVGVCPRSCKTLHNDQAYCI